MLYFTVAIISVGLLVDGWESPYQFVKRRAACLDLGGDIDQSLPPYQNWFDHVVFGNPTVNATVSAYVHGVGPVVDKDDVNTGLHSLGRGLLLDHHMSTPYTPHFQEVMKRMNTTLPVYGGLCKEDDEVHHLRTMQCVGMLGFTSSSLSPSAVTNNEQEPSSSSSSLSEAATPEERKANRRKRAVARTLYGGGYGSDMTVAEGTLRQQLWCRALLTCDGGRNGFLDLCAHVIGPLDRARQDALTFVSSSSLRQTTMGARGREGAGGHHVVSELATTLSASAIVRLRLLRTQERRRLRERREEREFEEEDAAEEARARLVQASMQYSRERPGEGDDLLSMSSNSFFTDDSNSAESFLVY